MKQKVLVAGALLMVICTLLGLALRAGGVALSLSPAAAPAPVDETPAAGEAAVVGPHETTIGRAGRAWRNLGDFEATVAVLRADGTALAAARLWFAKPNRVRLQTIRPAAGASEGATLVFDGTRLWVYSPADGRVIAVEGPARALLLARFLVPPPLPALPLLELASFLESLAGRDDARVVGEEVLDGHATILVEVGPAGQQLWLAGESGQPYQLSFLNPAGDQRFSLRLAELATDVGLADDLFRLEIPAGVQVLKADLPQTAARLGWWSPPAAGLAGTPFPVLAPPAGEAAPGAPAAYVASLGEQQAVIIPLAGEAYLLETAAATPAPELPGTVVALDDGTVAYRSQVGPATTLTWVRAGTRITLVGEVTPERALALANGLVPR